MRAICTAMAAVLVQRLDVPDVRAFLDDYLDLPWQGGAR
jgi:hypothetical protein